MKIKSIEICNFRIYKGLNKIDLANNKSEKNIIIISGKNGFGKTSFLMALVWCLYGKHMPDVDELYKREISAQGGYNKYIFNSLNRLAKKEGDTKFFITITFSDVNIPEIPCKEIKIKRSYEAESTMDEDVEILIDNDRSDIPTEMGFENFIREFILPIEIAKFFLFDAEKIVNLAEVNTSEQRKNLSQAYSEVLGIKKYENLKKDLEQYQRELREEFASSDEKKLLVEYNANLEKLEINIKDNHDKILEIRNTKDEMRKELTDIQERLIRAGGTISHDDYKNLKLREEELEVNINSFQEDLKKSFDFIPFAITGNRIVDIKEQLVKESNYKSNQFIEEKIKQTTNHILTDLMKAPIPVELPIDYGIQKYYCSKFEELIRKHFFDNTPAMPEDFKIIHDFSDTLIEEFDTMYNNLKISFRKSFERLNGDYNQARNELNLIRKKLKEAETKQGDEIIQEFKKKQDELEESIIKIENTIESMNREIGEWTNEKTQIIKNIDEITKKIKVGEANKEKDQIAEDSINILRDFIVNFKEQKKKSLEAQILNSLKSLMHKKGFISKVKVDIIGDDIDILIFNKRGEEIIKESLSKGEQQMYATALLMGLVEESEIEFPVFIDSPMQKFDEEHAENIIKNFYPKISDQVILFPLINKELNQEEFKILSKNISKAFLINNINEDHSEFLPVLASELIKVYNQKYKNVN